MEHYLYLCPFANVELYSSKTISAILMLTAYSGNFKIFFLFVGSIASENESVSMHWYAFRGMRRTTRLGAGRAGG